MKFSYIFLQSFFERKLPAAEKLAEILTMRSFEVESLQKIEIGNKKDFQLEIDVLPNRTDCYSHFGIAREIAGIFGWKLKFPKIILKEENKKIDEIVSLNVRAGCKRYCGKVIVNPVIQESPEWIKERLEVCGVKPINNIVDITNYVMLELGQPLHAFDLDKIEGKEIVVRFAKSGEKILTLDNEEYDLEEDILVIADTKKPLAIAGIKGGKESGVTSETKTILLESANFDPVLIRRASIKIDLKTDASLRFSHGLDPNLAELALNRACALIAEICQGKIIKGTLDFYPQKIFPQKIKFEKEKVEKILGIKIAEQKMLKILKNLGFKISKRKIIEIPTFRRDIFMLEDLIEEIGRIWGYEKIESKLPSVFLSFPQKNVELFWENKIKEILVSFGFNEALNYSFCSIDDIKIFKLENEALEIENPVSTNFQFLRPTLIANLLKNISKNLSNFKEIKIFEIGKVFKKEIKEHKQLTILMTGEKFYEAKGIIEVLFKKLGIFNFCFDLYELENEDNVSIWRKTKTAEIKIDGKKIGFLGEISSQILEKYGIDEKITAVDLDLEDLIKMVKEEVKYEPFSIYPPVIRDISVLVPLNVLAREILTEIKETGGDLIYNIELFDIYEKKEEGKKSLTFRLFLQSTEKALSPNEIDLIQEKIIENLEKHPDWEVRKK